MIDENGRFVRWNDYFRKTLGWSDEDMCRISVLDIVVPMDRQRVVKAMQDVLLKGKATLELTVLTRDGRKSQSSTAPAAWKPTGRSTS